eukprot:21089_1
MASVISTTAEGSVGEAIDDKSLKSYLIKNGQNLKDKTYQILKEEGIETIEDFKNFTVDDFERMCSEMTNKIAYGDRVKLKKVLQSFSTKDKFVDTQEVEAIETIKNEINKLKNALQNFNLTQTKINQKKEKMAKNINDTFEELVNKMRNRQKQLLVQLDNIMDSKNKTINTHINLANNSIENYQQKMQKCQKMITQSIELSDIKTRKLQIVEMRDDIVKRNEQIMNTFADNAVHANASFIIEKDDFISCLSKVGAVAEHTVPKLIELKCNDSGTVNIIWTLLYKQQGKKYDKITIEWSEVRNKQKQQDDEKNENNLWQSKEISIEETKEDVYNATISVTSVGIYLFRIKVFECGFSNTKSIHIQRVLSDIWFQKIIGKDVIIKENTIVQFNQSWCRHTVYGNKVVKPNECHEWKLMVKSDLKDTNAFIGIIPDDEELLKDTKDTYPTGHFIYKAVHGSLRDPPSNQYPQRKLKKGDILRLTLDLQNDEVRMSINNDQYGAVPEYKPTRKNYRFFVSVNMQACEFQLM